MILAKSIPQLRKPEEGDFRITEHFAWWPKRVKEGLIFLEKYKRIEQWSVKLRLRERGWIFSFINEGSWDIVEEKRVSK